MAKVRMFHAASNRYQYDAAANFEAFYQPEGWVIVDDDEGQAPEAPAEEAPVVEPADVTPEPEAEAPATKRGARAK